MRRLRKAVPRTFDLTPVDPDMQRARRDFMAAFDRLPAEVRKVLRDCSFDIHITRRLPAGMDCTNLIAAIHKIKTERQALEFMQQNAGWGNSIFRFR